MTNEEIAALPLQTLLMNSLESAIRCINAGETEAAINLLAAAHWRLAYEEKQEEMAMLWQWEPLPEELTQ